MLENLKSLKDDMVNKNWTICSFIFQYDWGVKRSVTFDINLYLENLTRYSKTWYFWYNRIIKIGGDS
ncbi:MAG: hypothetical protein LBV33_06195, partial [Lachnospiraceae bacterium]|nr:hypothetical protein [Lachnospiraceae bacterium]